MFEINLVCTSKPHDGLLFYSYEYTRLLNDCGYITNLYILPHRGYNASDYLTMLDLKYDKVINVLFDGDPGPCSVIMGRSMLTLGYFNYQYYSNNVKLLAHELFSNVISVYSENHFNHYSTAVDFFNSDTIDIGDTEVYSFNGIHFEKHIYFDIYNPPNEDLQFKYLFNGSNDQYYAAVERNIDSFLDHAIMVHKGQKVNNSLNNIVMPVDNLLGMFDTYVYTKSSFDPAPRIIQECKHFNKSMIYCRDKSLIDGGSVYWDRPLTKPDISPILEAMNENRT